MPEAVLGFGSNLGARRALMRCALGLLAAQPGLRVLARSAIYETPPLGPPQPDYLNAAVRVAWCGSLEGLFRVTERIELLLGRERRERWGARTIDIDILHWSAGSVRTPWLEVPHAELEARPFALAPLLDVSPELEDSLGPRLQVLGGPPARATDQWLERLSAARCDVEISATLEDAEIACLAVSAVGMCARTPAKALASLSFQSLEPPIERAQSFLVRYAQGLQKQGFCPVDAAITATDEHGTRGFMIGEHTGTAMNHVSWSVVLGPTNGLMRRLSAFPPPKP